MFFKIVEFNCYIRYRIREQFWKDNLFRGLTITYKSQGEKNQGATFFNEKSMVLMIDVLKKNNSTLNILNFKDNYTLFGS